METIKRMKETIKTCVSWIKTNIWAIVICLVLCVCGIMMYNSTTRDLITVSDQKIQALSDSLDARILQLNLEIDNANASISAMQRNLDLLNERIKLSDKQLQDMQDAHQKELDAVQRKYTKVQKDIIKLSDSISEKTEN